jgi:hypothetical protein
MTASSSTFYLYAMNCPPPVEALRAFMHRAVNASCEETDFKGLIASHQFALLDKDKKTCG